MQVEEQAAVARMTEKHAQEMLLLIEQKVYSGFRTFEI